LKELDTQENLERMEMQNRMKYQRLQQKLERDQERSELIKYWSWVTTRREKENMVRASSQIRKEAEEKRQKYLHDFELTQKKKNQSTGDLHQAEAPE
jgi:hypothetical protein